ncbi:serine protease [Streptomyces phaeochromogenes]|uniref:Serine protease n=1 Tax=Streptomyces phaeochromogenes TaxID=1923 RepID=A0ABZ1HBK2_STRPH|nr:serine protease [Streptomyces phaeochromogenes]WSD15959.1 serine protease [Streptomyces phaeochromogenes]
MSGPLHWVQIDEGDRHLGAGFLITRGFVLTALHCLRRLSSSDARMDLQLPDKRRIPGRLCDSIEEADLALIAVEHAHAHGLPPAPPTDWPRPEVNWHGRYCPPGENTQLSGKVTHAPVPYRSRGGTFTGLQLTVDQLLGDFSGYSGSPVETDSDRPDPRERPVVGILMQEQLSRADGSSGSNVLYAASIRHAMELFPYFDVGHLRHLVSGQPAEVPAPQAIEAVPETEATPEADDQQTRSPTTDTDEFLRSLRQWEESGLISQADADEHRRHALRKLSDRLLGRGLDD